MKTGKILLACMMFTGASHAMADNVKARKLCPDGRYRRVETLGPTIDAQAELLASARRGG